MDIEKFDEIVAECNATIRYCKVQLNRLDDMAIPWRWFVWWHAHRTIAHANSSIRQAESARRHNERACKLDARVKELQKRK